MRTAHIVEWGLTREAKAQPVTPVQKFCMCIVGAVVLGSFVMVSLQEMDVVESNSPIFSHMLFSTITAIFGYLFGSNMRTPLSGD